MNNTDTHITMRVLWYVLWVPRLTTINEGRWVWGAEREPQRRAGQRKQNYDCNKQERARRNCCIKYITWNIIVTYNCRPKRDINAFSPMFGCTNSLTNLQPYLLITMTMQRRRQQCCRLKKLSMCASLTDSCLHEFLHE